MAFKGSVLHTPPFRRRKRYHRQPPPVPVTPQFVLHLPGREPLPFDNMDEAKRWFETRKRELGK